MRHSHVAVNFIDIYFRTGLYKADSPYSLGMEGAGVVTAVGPGVAGGGGSVTETAISGQPSAVGLELC